jgi:hypothetical protein
MQSKPYDLRKIRKSIQQYQILLKSIRNPGYLISENGQDALYDPQTKIMWTTLELKDETNNRVTQD